MPRNGVNLSRIAQTIGTRAGISGGVTEKSYQLGNEKLFVPPLISPEQAMVWGSGLTPREHVTLVRIQRRLSEAAASERDPRRMVILATQAELMREAADMWVNFQKDAPSAGKKRRRQSGKS